MIDDERYGLIPFQALRLVGVAKVACLLQSFGDSDRVLNNDVGMYETPLVDDQPGLSNMIVGPPVEGRPLG